MPTLNWIGKDKVINHHQDVPFRVLDRKYAYGVDNGNMIIHGDNLDALKALLAKYEGRIKCIYIDPPYNTGNEGWVYNDNVNDPKIKKWLGEVVGREGEDLSRHDKWLCMMYPRLKLLQRLLSNDGAIFISIDDNEQANLKLICDEIFGVNNFVAMFAWEKRKNRENRKQISSRHEYILCFGKNLIGKRIINQLPMTPKALANYKNPDNDPRGLWKSDPVIAQAGHGTKSQFYTLIAPNGKRHELESGCCWRFSEEAIKREIAEGRIWFGKDGNGVPRKKTYLNEKDRGLTPESIIFAEDVGTTEIAKNKIKEQFEGIAVFETPKPVDLIRHFVMLVTNSGDIILDSFAGSGTTAHAVLNMNKQDGGSRKFILVEMMDYAESITAERVRRVIDGYADVEGTGGSFDFYELGEPLLFADGNINESVSTEKIRDYVWYMETKLPTQAVDSKAGAYYLGKTGGTAYYFYYEKERMTTLDMDFFTGISARASNYVIYADQCAVSESDLKKYNVTFKKIPRDVAKL